MHIIYCELLLYNLSPTNLECLCHELVRLNHIALAGLVTIYNTAKVQLIMKLYIRMPIIGWTYN